MNRVPSYDLKVDRAEQHLIDAELEIRRYARTHPYAVRRRMENKRDVYRLEFTRQPDEYIALIVGDFLYNIHSALNHLAASLVPSNKRSSVAFPIFWQGVWEPEIEGENEQRTKDRQRWLSYTRKMPDEAVAILKGCQPSDARGGDNTHALAVLNRLRNTDAHTKLAVVSSTLIQPVFRCIDAAGEVYVMADRTMGPREGLADGTPIAGIPNGTVKVEVQGTPEVTVRIRQSEGEVPIVEAFRKLLLGDVRRVIDLLRPYDRRK